MVHLNIRQERIANSFVVKLTNNWKEYYSLKKATIEDFQAANVDALKIAKNHGIALLEAGIKKEDIKNILVGKIKVVASAVKHWQLDNGRQAAPHVFPFEAGNKLLDSLAATKDTGQKLSR